MNLCVVVLAAAVSESLGAVRALVGFLARVQAVVHGQVLLHLELGRAHVAPPPSFRVVRGSRQSRRGRRPTRRGGLKHGPVQVRPEAPGICDACGSRRETLAKEWMEQKGVSLKGEDEMEGGGAEGDLTNRTTPTIFPYT